jgi:hypothetical protein
MAPRLTTAWSSSGSRRRANNSVPENANNKWTTEEDVRLKSLVEANTSAHLIAARLKRSVDAVKARAQALSISMKRVEIGIKMKGK